MFTLKIIVADSDEQQSPEGYGASMVRTEPVVDNMTPGETLVAGFITDFLSNHLPRLVEMVGGAKSSVGMGKTKEEAARNQKLARMQQNAGNN